MEEAVAFVRLLQGEKDKALAELTTTKCERDEMGATLAHVESKLDEILGSAELTPEPPNEEHQQELEECREALQQTKAELEHTKDELQRAEVRLRAQAMKMRQAAKPAGADW